MSEKRIILFGGGGHCRSCIDVIESTGEYSIAGIVEQPEKENPGPVLGYPVVGNDNQLDLLKEKYDYALITVGQVGEPLGRKKIFDRLKTAGFVLPTIISSLAHVSRHASVGEGTIIMHGVVVNAGASVGQNCILNTMCLIEHDVQVGDHTHISTASVLNGEATVGSGCFIGSNATVVHCAALPENHFFKAGRLITSGKDGTAYDGFNLE